MFHIDNSFLHSKFARRIFLLFVLSAIIPTAVIGLLSYKEITKQLEQQSSDQSHVVCKAIGMELYRRLTMAQQQLRSINNSLIQSSKRISTGTISRNDDPDFEEITVFAQDKRVGNLPGQLEQMPFLTKELKHQLATGKTVIQIQLDRERRPDVLLIQLLNKNNMADGILVGKLDADFLWAVNDLLPPASELLVMNIDGGILYRSKPSLQTMVQNLKVLLENSITGHLEWRLDGDKNLASYWSVFIQDLFAGPDLVIVVSQPETIALSSTAAFRSIYFPLLILFILCISFVAAMQIRKKLIPLVGLRNATQRIANGDFTGRVNITSDDEFATLGDAFNVMAGHLETQFTNLATMGEIDRLILSSFDVRFIISTVLGRAGELTPCTQAAILHFHNEDMAFRGTLSLKHNVDGVSLAEQDVELSPEDMRKLHDNASHLVCNVDLNCPEYMKTLIGDGTRTLLVFPTFIKERLSTVLILGYADVQQMTADGINSLRKFADHVAVALSNAGWEEKLYQQAHYDNLTNLPNRALLKDRLEQAIARAQRNQDNVGVLFLDLDRFKLVNDSLGHAAGDKVLKRIAAKLISGVRNVDTVVRFGGDEFVIIVPDIAGDSNTAFELGKIAEKIFNATQSELEIDGQIVNPKMSIGIALYPKDGSAPDDLIKNADAAMYHAKNKGRARYEFFAPELNEVASHRLQLEQDMRRGLARGEFLLHFQPKIETVSGHLVGAEALIRWNHPVRGLVTPVDFIGVAEETGQILGIGEWVIQNTCEKLVAWRTEGLDPVPISLNVSPNQFREKNFTRIVSDILEQTGLAPNMLELEITETTLMVDVDEAIAKLMKCRDMGVRISMDDFGTGYSSLSYLRRLPLHTLKIDKSFIENISEEDETKAIVAAIIILAHKMGLKVVAEGVETVEQRDLLQEMECDVLQGYLISKPLIAWQFAKRFLHMSHDMRNAAS